MKQILWVVALLLSLSIPAHSANVAYDDALRIDVGKQGIFLDRAGDLYPPGEVAVDTGKIFMSTYTGSADQASFGTLKALYRWKSLHEPDDWHSLKEFAGTPAGASFDEEWDATQARLRERVTSALGSTGADHVVLLIHGFNNTGSEARKGFEHWHSLLDSYPGTSAFEVYWDGLSSRIGPVVWGKAQWNGPLVGLGLRRIVNQLPANVPLRIVTHSSGAFVLTDLLGNGSVNFTEEKPPSDYIQRSSGRVAGYEFPKKLDDLRVAMIAPAAPTTTYKAFDGGVGGAVPSRVILGVNPKDYLATKARLLCRRLGASCMTRFPVQACTQVGKDLQISPPRLQVVNFSSAGLFNGHSVKSYTGKTKIQPFLDLLLAPSPTAIYPDTRNACGLG